MQNQNDPKHVQELMGESILASIVQKAQILDKINRFLPELLSQELTMDCQVLNLKSNCLILACSSAAIATQLRYREDDVILRLNRLIPDLPQIDRLECVVRP